LKDFVQKKREKILISFNEQEKAFALWLSEACACMSERERERELCGIFFIYMKIFVCLLKQARLLAIISNFFLGGGG
jgi:hypothetical protein